MANNRNGKFTDTHIENGHFFCVYARAGEEITILRSIYADRKPSHRKPSHAKEKNFANRLTRISLSVHLYFRYYENSSLVEGENVEMIPT